MAQNPQNGHAHLIYGLDVPVRTAPDAKSAPLRYAAAVDCALRAVLGADEDYAGLICKNPLHPHWRVTEWEPRLYRVWETLIAGLIFPPTQTAVSGSLLMG